jgi:hypothetical protein
MATAIAPATAHDVDDDDSHEEGFFECKNHMDICHSKASS